jgi:hypothetical protein
VGVDGGHFWGKSSGSEQDYLTTEGGLPYAGKKSTKGAAGPEVRARRPRQSEGQKGEE